MEKAALIAPPMSICLLFAARDEDELLLEDLLDRLDRDDRLESELDDFEELDLLDRLDRLESEELDFDELDLLDRLELDFEELDLELEDCSLQVIVLLPFAAVPFQ